MNKLYSLFSKTTPETPDNKAKYAEEALIIAKETGNRFIQTKALIFLGKESTRNKSNDKARRYLTEAISLSNSFNNEYLEAEASIKFGFLLGDNLNKPDSALIFTKRAYSTGISLNDSTLLKSASSFIFRLYRQLQDPVNALKIAPKALEYNKNDNMAKVGIFVGLGIIYHDTGNPKEANKYYELALLQSEANKNELQIANVLNNIAVGNAQMQNWETALINHNRAINIYKKYKEPFGTAYSYNLLGMTYSAWGKSNEAIDNFSKSIKIFLGINNLRNISFTYANLGIEYLKTGKMDSAYSNLVKSIVNGKITNDKLVLTDVYKAMAIYYRKKKYA